ncbi:hypothetical protein [Paraburkholderia fungorum]|jgi:hypothetical protein|uniref:hypothetical protein n=1 Tax=Paraburkholderia fungorum TaxID=134537 RepID=UPI000D04EA76|nr:hypothetical protein [Paraburkholderia fungorum]PRZ45405.1 hypothetical protein BX589_13984 [Paraburkholderia fungorum]
MLTRKELEEVFSYKPKSHLLRQQIKELERELGINQIPTKEEYLSHRNILEKLQLKIGLATEADVIRGRLNKYEMKSIILNLDGTVSAQTTNFGITLTRVSEKDAVIILTKKLDELKQLKAKKR